MIEKEEVEIEEVDYGIYIKKIARKRKRTMEKEDLTKLKEEFKN